MIQSMALLFRALRCCYDFTILWGGVGRQKDYSVSARNIWFKDLAFITRRFESPRVSTPDSSLRHCPAPPPRFEPPHPLVFSGP